MSDQIRLLTYFISFGSQAVCFNSSTISTLSDLVAILSDLIRTQRDAYRDKSNQSRRSSNEDTCQLHSSSPVRDFDNTTNPTEEASDQLGEIGDASVLQTDIPVSIDHHLIPADMHARQAVTILAQMIDGTHPYSSDSAKNCLDTITHALGLEGKIVNPPLISQSQPDLLRPKTQEMNRLRKIAYLLGGACTLQALTYLARNFQIRNTFKR
ncbi:hypothetical protein [Trueperella pyogenes]|uniref:hypothetical protein n=1 Tax=Trueperella pyogenes TaxID=1661 RepID=UPI00345D4A7C